MIILLYFFQNVIIDISLAYNLILCLYPLSLNLTLFVYHNFIHIYLVLDTPSVITSAKSVKSVEIDDKSTQTVTCLIPRV